MIWSIITGLLAFLNVMQGHKSMVNKRVLRGLKIQVNQLLAYCNDAQKQGLIGQDERETSFVVSLGHKVRGIERQLEDIIGPTAVREIQTGTEKFWHRWWRLL